VVLSASLASGLPMLVLIGAGLLSASFGSVGASVVLVSIFSTGILSDMLVLDEMSLWFGDEDANNIMSLYSPIYPLRRLDLPFLCLRMECVLILILLRAIGAYPLLARLHNTEGYTEQLKAVKGCQLSLSYPTDSRGKNSMSFGRNDQIHTF
jgi:hypothetical protein